MGDVVGQFAVSLGCVCHELVNWDDWHALSCLEVSEQSHGDRYSCFDKIVTPEHEIPYSKGKFF